MTNERDPLTPKQRKALLALLEGLTTPQVAERVGVHRQTVWQWLQQPTFQAELRMAEQHQLGTIARALGAAGWGSVATLVALKDDPEVPPAVRVRAASEILGKLLPLREMIELEQRLAVVEAALAEREGGHG